MDYIASYREPSRVNHLLKEIKSIPLKKEIKIMEVCGTHTMCIRKFGIDNALPENIKLLSGPGCPVCVTPTSYVDTAINLAKRKDIIIATFGDMVKVSGTSLSLEKAKADGAMVKVIYSPIETLSLAQKYKDKMVVLLSIGFETTVPAIAITVLEAKKRNLKNFFILEGNKLIPPAIKTILEDKDINIDGFILPGHVCTITGYKMFEFISKKFNIPCSVAGFEPVDLLLAIKELIYMILHKKPEVKNLYPRAVRYEGNIKAKRIMEKVFESCDSTWRGMGNIRKSGLTLTKEFKEFDVTNAVDIGNIKSRDNPLCLCGEILKGKALPNDCPLFGKGCTPYNPKGPCMISSEGTCAAYYKYRDLTIKE